jgi:anti-sigma regulatory factor (Ser/Thr protein kinase)
MPYYLCAACGLTSYSAATYSSLMTCPTCQADLAEGAKVDIVPGSVHDVSCTVMARPAAAGEARRAFTRLALPELTREDLALLVSELVTNAVRHAGLSSRDPIDVKLVNGGRTVRLAVHDGGHGFAFSPARDEGPPVAGGRGLAIVDALSASWGVDREGDGCTVWCELAVDAA